MAGMNVKQAVQAAKDALRDLYDDDPPVAMALEEVEKTSADGRPMWAVTLGFCRPAVNGKPHALGGLFSPSGHMHEHRIYKTLFIDAGTGEFVKMDMRQVH